MTGFGTVSRPSPTKVSRPSRTRQAVLLATLLSLGLAVGGVAEAQTVKPPANDDCLACHSDPDTKRANGTSLAVNPTTFEHSKHGPLACVDCHKDLATLQEFPHAEKLAKVSCASCHDAEAAKYHDSIHAWAKEKAGLTASAPACADCHGTHDIKGPGEPTSRVSRPNIPATCGACHKGVVEQYSRGIHAAALANGNAKAPVCSDCHTAHTIRRVDTEAWRLDVLNECGSCHAESLRTYRDTFHGQVTALGFVRVATCADCHGSHDIKPKRDSDSRIASAQLLATCGQCHHQANASFVRYDPHADRHNHDRSPVLYWVGIFMDGLLVTVFSFFGVHTLLWLGRGLHERRNKGDGASGRPA
jgi:nitrate/TMAO reductase-like tetraheme cytochrome c subunit